MKLIDITSKCFRPLCVALAAMIFTNNPRAVAQRTAEQTAPAAARAQIRSEKQQRGRAAQQILDLQRSALALTADDTFEPRASVIDRTGRTHVLLERYYKGVRVAGGSVKVAVAADGVNGGMSKFASLKVAPQSVVPEVREVAVRDIIARDLSLTAAEIQDKLELVILPGTGEQAARLAWLAVVEAPRIDAMLYYVNAATGGIISKRTAYPTDNPAVAGTGNSFYYGQVPLITREIGNQFRLQDSTRGDSLVYDMQNSVPQGGSQGNHYWDGNNTWGNGQDWVPADATTGATGQTAAVDAMWGARLTWDTLKNVFDHLGIGDDNGPMRLRVHVQKEAGKLWGDANWDGTYANFGDGGSEASAHKADLDTVSHELGHGIWDKFVAPWQETSGEGAGLNEGHGDIVAAIVMHYVGLANTMGSTVPTSTQENLSMFRERSINPEAWRSTGLRYYVHTQAGHKKMEDYEVHEQGCVYGRMFATLVMGAPSAAEYAASGACAPGDGRMFKCLYSEYLPQGMVGIGMQKAADIWYKATTENFDANPTFHEVRDDFLAAAFSLFGPDTPEYKAVENAFHAVAIGNPAIDTANPTVSLWDTTVDDFEQTLFVVANGFDDMGVHHVDGFAGASVRTQRGRTFRNYVDLAPLSYGVKEAGATAYDSAGKSGMASRNVTYKGANYAIANGGFEQGSNSWTTSGGGMIASETGGSFVGNRYVSFNGSQWIRQQFQAPRAATQCTVGYRVRVNPGSNPSQALLAELMESNGTTVRTVLNTVTAATNTTDSNSNNYKSYKHAVLDCAERQLWIRFRSVVSSPDTFRVDNAYVVYHAPPSADFFVEANPAERSVIFEVKNIQNMDPALVKRVEVGSPGGIPSSDGYAPYVIIKSTNDFMPATQYSVAASLVDFADDKVFTSPVKKFTINPVNELFLNPDFETSLNPWDTSGSVGHCHFNPAGGEAPEAFIGTGCAWFEGSGSVSQQVSLPGGLGLRELTLRLKIEKGTFADKFLVKVENINTGVVTTVLDIPGNTLTTQGISHRNYQRQTVNLNAFAGQTVRIRFEAMKFSASPMLFFLDNVGVSYSGIALK